MSTEPEKAGSAHSARPDGAPDDRKTEVKTNDDASGSDRSPPTDDYVADPAEEKTVLRKIDLTIMPAMTFVYFFQYLDKQTINYATVFGMNKDLGLSGEQFSWVVTLFYFGQLTSEFLASYFLSRYPVTRVVGITVFLWGACEMCMGATHNFAGIAAVRFCLGLCEGSASPAWVIITSNWYTRIEHPNRVAIWSCMAGVAQIVGAVLMYLIGQAPPMAVDNWRAMFLVCGGATVVSGVLFAVCVPADGSRARFLTPSQRRAAVGRLARDRATRDRSRFDRDQAREALSEPASWLFFLMAFFVCLPSPILKFSSLVINGFGFSRFDTMLVGLPSGGIQIITIASCGLAMRHTRNRRCIVGALAALIPLVGSSLLLGLPVPVPASAGGDGASGGGAAWGIVVATWLAAQSSALILVSLALIASNIKGNTKKGVVNALFFVGYSVGCIAGPQLWTERDAPRYRRGCIASIISWILLLVCFAAYYWLCRRENARRDRLAAETAAADDTPETTVAAAALDSDLTDTQDLKFRYTL